MRTIALLIVSTIAAVPVSAQTSGPGEDKTPKTKVQKNAKNSPASKKKVVKSRTQSGDNRPTSKASK